MHANGTSLANLYPLCAGQPCTQPTDGADWPNAHNISTLIRRL